MRSYPHLADTMGVPPIWVTGGYHHVADGGTPDQNCMGVPQARIGYRYPLPARTGYGYPLPPGLDGMPPARTEWVVTPPPGLDGSSPPPHSPPPRSIRGGLSCAVCFRRMLEDVQEPYWTDGSGEKIHTAKPPHVFVIL